MLARSFLTAEDLGIRQDWHDALVKTLDAMERGEIVHLKEVNIVDRRYDSDPDKRLYLGRFNMNYWKENADCGTVACIGGTAEILGNIRFNVELSPGLTELFYPTLPDSIEGNGDDYNFITVEQAADALRRYLIVGAPNWDGVLSEPR